MTASPASQLAVSEGDTVLIGVHRVRTEHRVEYERFMRDSWYPAARQLASRNAEFGEALAKRWRLVATEPGNDSLVTYLFIYPVVRDAPFGTWEIYRAGGVPPEQAARDSARWAEWARPEGLVAVRDEY